MRVFHMSGAGNDFAVIDARGLYVDMEKTAVALCAALKTDGFMALDQTPEGQLRLHFYNSDGMRGEMCGNGARCICRFAYDLGLAGEQITLHTDAGVVVGQRLAQDRYRVRLNLPSVADLHRLEACSYVELGDPGVPHCMIRVPGLCWDMAEDLRCRGKLLRYHPAFPKGANVNFYDKLQPSVARILTYERGVEDFTLACGTGSTSLAVSLFLQGQLPGNVLTVENRGGNLTVTVEARDGEITALYLEGPACYIKEYDIDL